MIVTQGSSLYTSIGHSTCLLLYTKRYGGDLNSEIVALEVCDQSNTKAVAKSLPIICPNINQYDALLIGHSVMS